MAGNAQLRVDRQAANTPKTGSALDRVLAQAPYLSRCSDDKTASRIRPREYAIRYPYMQANRRDMVSWLVFDCDDQKDVFNYESVGLPAPNLIVANRSNEHEAKGGFHLFYAIVPVCRSDKAHSHPVRYMQALYDRMVVLLGADAAYHGASGSICKTPGHAWWHTISLHNHEYQLGELHEYFELPAAQRSWNKPPDLSLYHHQRHESLFHELRYFAYSKVVAARANGQYEAFYQQVAAEAERLNDYGSKRGFMDVKRNVPKPDLSLSQVRATVRSVARWTWDTYTGDGRCNRGVMRLNKALPLADRQRLSAKRTHSERTNKTGDRVRAACAILRGRGEAVTQVAIARITRLTRQTVAAYRQLIDEHPPTQNAPVQGQSGPEPCGVKFGARQIPAPPAAAGKAAAPRRNRPSPTPHLKLVVGKPPPLDSS